MKNLNYNDNKPLVAVWSLVYNHEPYLRDYFEGIVMQKTDFPFVAIVHDDCSTDGSAAVIREYAAKYPDIIKPIFETENQYSKKDGSLDRIMRDAIEKTGAKYIAFCEGDDYWTDPQKLQKQVDFLESHPDYSLCCTDFKSLNHINNKIKDCILTDKSILTFNSLLHEYNKIATLTVMIRFYIVNNYATINVPWWPLGDYPLWLFATHYGNAYKFKEKTAIYRILENSASHFTDKEGKYKFDLAINEIRIYFAKLYNHTPAIYYIIKLKFIITNILSNRKIGLNQLRYIFSNYYR